MMPSRGVQFARIRASRMYQLQRRHLSSVRPRSPFQSPSQRTIWRTPGLSLPVTTMSIRHASQSAPLPANATPPQPAPAPPAESLTSDSFPNLDTITVSPLDISMPIPETESIGYLHSLGIDYGYGPTSMISWVVEHIHIVGGLPWWGSIACTAVLMRLLLAPLFIKSSDAMARQTAITPITKPITERMQAAQRAGDRDSMMAALQEVRTIRQRAGIRVRDQFAPMVVQGVFGFCGFRLIRAMAELPVPALKYEGPGWLTDLTLTDPYLILPLAMAGTVHVLVRMGGESGAAQTNAIGPNMQLFMRYGLPSIIVVAMGYQSAALCIWFASSGAVGVVQSLVLRNAKVRAALGIAPLYQATPEEAKSSITQGLWGAVNPLQRSSAPGSPPADVSNSFVAAGKNQRYMNPTYQSPSLRRNNSRSSTTQGRILDTTTTSTPSAESSSSANADEMIQADAPSGETKTVFNAASNSWQHMKKRFQDRVTSSPEAVAERKKKNFKKMADAYEKRAQARKGGR